MHSHLRFGLHSVAAKTGFSCLSDGHCGSARQAISLSVRHNAIPNISWAAHDSTVEVIQSLARAFAMA